MKSEMHLNSLSCKPLKLNRSNILDVFIIDLDSPTFLCPRIYKKR